MIGDIYPKDFQKGKSREKIDLSLILSVIISEYLLTENCQLIHQNSDVMYISIIQYMYQTQSSNKEVMI